jgi:hypothetical protein
VTLYCWWHHRRTWITLAAGWLPLKLDGSHFCPLCDDGGHGGKARGPRLAYT